MPLTAVERQAYYNAIDASGMESDIAKATLRARIENIDTGAPGAITRDQFHTEMRNALEAAKVETVVGSKWDATVTAALGGRAAGNPGNIDVTAFETTITTGVYPDIRDKVIASARDRLADKHIEYFLNSTTLTSQNYVDGLRGSIGFSQELADRIVARTQQYIEKRVEGIKVQLDSGTLTEAQVRAMISAGGTITNPQLRSAITKFLDDPTRVQARKEAADKTTMNTDAANFKTELDATGINNDFEVDFDDLTTRITGLPEYANLSGPVRAMVEAHMANKNEQMVNKRAQSDLKDVVNDASVREKAVERNRAFISLALRRLQWIGIGALAGGSIAALLSGGNIWLTGLVAGVGAAGSMGLAHAFDVELATRTKELAQSQSRLLEQQNQRITLMSQRHTQEGEAVKTYTKIAALVEALTKGLDKDKAVSTYLKTCSVDALEDLLAV